jgi:hypothetical protein
VGVLKVGICAVGNRKRLLNRERGRGRERERKRKIEDEVRFTYARIKSLLAVPKVLLAPLFRKKSVFFLPSLSY